MSKTNSESLYQHLTKNILPRIRKDDKAQYQSLMNSLLVMKALPKFILDDTIVEMDNDALVITGLPFNNFVFEYNIRDANSTSYHIVNVVIENSTVMLRAHFSVNFIEWIPLLLKGQIYMNEEGLHSVELLENNRNRLSEAEYEEHSPLCSRLYRLHLSTLLNFLSVLSCDNVEVEDAPRRKLKKGERLAARPDNTYKVLKIVNTVTDDNSRLSNTEKVGRSPREHIRRGHVCNQRIKNGHKRIWRNAITVNKGVGGVVVKDYKVC